ncbi:VOC family protein [Marinilongibacter aquaticus]|uniref:VOC family protein n=1 Tax=Marinilongibacter aquaticus TaxID=2975157 RepID=UPI0021BD1A26|nr:VOC family protein [Marinilongibacter aquaticus]UBM57506.1 VOC family protein [Marinilongibacter aquaticus]
MKIEHLAIWVEDLEKMKDFYTHYFEAQANELYHNPQKGFYSYFLQFASGCRLELMHKANLLPLRSETHLGYAHLAFSVGSKTRVDELTETMRSNGFVVQGEPRITGDGYYESVILDPEGNTIELTV